VLVIADGRRDCDLLDIKDSVPRVRSCLILGCVSNQTLLIGECDIRWCNSVALIVDKNLDLALLHHTDARVGRSQINADNCWSSCQSSIEAQMQGRREEAYPFHSSLVMDLDPRMRVLSGGMREG